MNWEVEIMKSKASYFSISKPLIAENLRRFWAIPALSFLVYFLSGVFPILMSYSHLNDISSYIRMSLANQQPFYMFAHLMFPIIAAVVIFRYLQGVSSVSVMHSMPFTRAKLYNSGFLSGLILIAAPILANGLILIAISKPVYRQYGTETGLVTEALNLFSRADILNWIWVSLIIAFVVYAVSVFAGIVTGNGLMHFATGIWFNFLIPALYAVFIAYFSHYLYGFDTSGNWGEYGMRISPFLNVLRSEGVFGAGIMIYYVASFLVLYGITGFLYQKRKLERATDTLVFGFMEPIICYLIAFLGMTLLGFYFEVLGESELYFYGGLAAGTVIFFIIGQMIVKKTPRIYNMKSLKSAGVYALIAVLFLLGLNFDVTGFERRVPSLNRIENFSINEEFALGGKFGTYYWNDRSFYKNSGDEGFRMKDPGNIAAVTSLHQSLIDNKARFEDMKSWANIYNSSVYLQYNPDAAISLTRRYQIDYDFFRNSPDFKMIYESKEFKDHFTPLNLDYTGLTSIEVNSEIPYLEPVVIKNQTDIMEFMACLDRDFHEQTFEDMVSLKRPYAAVMINFKFKNKNSDTPERPLDNSVTYRITENYANTIQWLADHGYSDRFVRSAADVEAIDLLHYARTEVIGAPGVYVQDRSMLGYGYATKEYSIETEVLQITDPEKIQELLDTYETQNINYSDYYYGVIYYKGNGELAPDQYYLDRYGYIPEPAEKYKMESSGHTVQIYFNEGNIPDYVLEYFKSKENR